MILVLTYHKVLRGPVPKADFYTLTAQELERQLELLSRSGLRALSPDELLACCSSAGTNGAQTHRQGHYLLTFDDGTVDHYEVVLPLLARYRQRAIFFSSSSRLDQPGHLTSAQAAEISRAGHTLGLHSHEHRRLDWLGEEDIRVQMEISAAALSDITGKPSVIFAPPGGYIDRRVRDIALEQGVRVIRTMRWGYNRRVQPTALQCVPLNRFFTHVEFERILKLRNVSWLYALKELTKRIIPAPAYSKLRQLVFGWLGRR